MKASLRPHQPRSDPGLRPLGLFLSEFLLSGACYLLATYVESDMEFLPEILEEQPWWLLGALTLAAQFWLARDGLYLRPRSRSKVELLARLSSAIGIAFLLTALVAYAAPGWAPPSSTMLVWGLLCIAAWLLWRLFYAAVVWNPFAPHRVLFLGTDPVVRQIAERLQQLGPSRSQCIPLGFLDEALAEGYGLAGARVLGSFRQIAEVAAALHPDRIVVGLPGGSERLPVRHLFDLRLGGVRVDSAGDFYETLFQRVAVRYLRPRDLLYQKQFGSRPRSLAFQAIYTNLLALTATALLLPVLGLVAAAIKLTSGSPILERHTCAGLEGLPFTLFRFRCRQLAQRDGKLGFRPTALGRWLERTRLDRLPELINVLRGEMSFVGPHPQRIEYAQVLFAQLPYYRQRYCVKPGLTGWEQINRRGAGELPDAELALEYDLFYIKHISASLDAYILLHTVV